MVMVQEKKNDLAETFEKYRVLFSKEESDEDLVFAATKTIEGLLTQALRKFLLKSTDSDTLFDPKKPLEPFHAKISIASRMGLISAGLADELRLLREIRREFRQKIDCATLDYEDVVAFCNNLKAPMQIRSRSIYANEHYPDTPRGNFELTVTILSSLLDDILSRTERTSTAPLH